MKASIVLNFHNYHCCMDLKIEISFDNRQSELVGFQTFKTTDKNNSHNDRLFVGDSPHGFGRGF